jgi:hypothetical protein
VHSSLRKKPAFGRVLYQRTTRDDIEKALLNLQLPGMPRWAGLKDKPGQVPGLLSWEAAAAKDLS